MKKPTQIKQFQNTRKKMKTYSKYFMWVWITFLAIAMLSVKVKIEITELWDKVNKQGDRIHALEVRDE